jgi:hypothetical protein
VGARWPPLPHNRRQVSGRLHADDRQVNDLHLTTALTLFVNFLIGFVGDSRERACTECVYVRRARAQCVHTAHYYAHLASGANRALFVSLLCFSVVFFGLVSCEWSTRLDAFCVILTSSCRANHVWNGREHGRSLQVCWVHCAACQRWFDPSRQSSLLRQATRMLGFRAP